MNVIVWGCLALLPGCSASADVSKKPRYQTLPPLREQAKILDSWTREREALIPSILRKYNVDAWLVRTALSSPCFFQQLRGLRFEAAKLT